MIDQLTTVSAAIVAVGAAAAVIYRVATRSRRKKGRLPWWRELARDFRKGRDTLVGREPVVDSITGRELAPALPGMGMRLDRVEHALVEIASQGRRLADLEVTVTGHGEQLGDHDEAIAELRAQAVERVVARAESTQALRTIEAAIHADPPANLPPS